MQLIDSSSNIFKRKLKTSWLNTRSLGYRPTVAVSCCWSL